MLFQRRFHPGLLSGEITLTFRRWSRPRVKAGGRYRCPPIGLLEVGSVTAVAVGEITDADAERAGFASRGELFAYLGKVSKRPVTPETVLFRVELRHAGADERPALAADDELSAGDVAELSEKLARMDRRSRRGPWTAEVLGLIARRPRVAASRLATAVGRETRAFKADVRKLKNLGLTTSHEVGYELSPRGRAFLALTRWGDRESGTLSSAQ